jgi:hypothetical protein
MLVYKIQIEDSENKLNDSLAVKQILQGIIRNGLMANGITKDIDWSFMILESK